MYKDIATNSSLRNIDKTHTKSNVNLTCEVCGFSAMDSGGLKIHIDLNVTYIISMLQTSKDLECTKVLKIQYNFKDGGTSTSILLVSTQRHATLGSHDQLTVQ